MDAIWMDALNWDQIQLHTLFKGHLSWTEAA